MCVLSYYGKAWLKWVLQFDQKMPTFTVIPELIPNPQAVQWESSAFYIQEFNSWNWQFQCNLAIMGVPDFAAESGPRTDMDQSHGELKRRTEKCWVKSKLTGNQMQRTAKIFMLLAACVVEKPHCCILCQVFMFYFLDCNEIVNFLYDIRPGCVTELIPTGVGRVLVSCRLTIRG